MTARKLNSLVDIFVQICKNKSVRILRVNAVYMTSSKTKHEKKLNEVKQSYPENATIMKHSLPGAPKEEG